MKNGLEKVIKDLQKENWDLFKMTKNDLDPHKLTRNQEQLIESEADDEGEYRYEN